jgi:hypothetical protein
MLNPSAAVINEEEDFEQWKCYEPAVGEEPDHAKNRLETISKPLKLHATD